LLLIKKSPKSDHKTSFHWRARTKYRQCAA